MSETPSSLALVRRFAHAHYEGLPEPMQDVVCSVYGVQERIRRRGCARNASRRMEEIERLHHDPDVADRCVESQLRRILDAARRARWYRLRSPDAGIVATEELERWPIVTKPDVRSEPEAFLTRTPRGTDIPSLTSGTTGTPLQVWRPRSAFRELFRSSDLSKSWFGVPHWARRASFTGKLVVPLRSSRVWRINLPGDQLVLSQYHLGSRTAHLYAEALRRWRPWVLDGYASNLIDLAAMFREQGISIRVPLVVTTCEMLTASGRGLLERTFGGHVADKYGTSENIVFASECPAGSRHIFPNVGIVEVVDDAGRRIADGRPGRLVLTTLTNDLMPLVRYEVGDIGIVDRSGGCSCGRTSDVLRELHGREDDVIVTRDGRRLALFAFQLLREMSGVLATQVVQSSPTTFEVRARLMPDGSAARAAFQEEIARGFDRLIGPDPERTLHFRYPDRLDRAPGGKIRNVVRTF